MATSITPHGTVLFAPGVQLFADILLFQSPAWMPEESLNS
jgi:hypothetical protein